MADDLERIDRFNAASTYLPFGAKHDDRLVAKDELGNDIYETFDGQQYTIPEMKTENRGSVVKAAGEAAYEYLKNPTIDTGKIAEFVGDTAKTMYEPFDKMPRGKATYGDVANVVGTVATPAWTTPAESGALHIFGGFGAKNPPSKTFKAAEEADLLGATAEETAAATGWHKNPHDKQWRFEIDDSQSVLAWDKIKPEINAQMKSKGNVYITTTVGDMIQHGKLYEQYPDLQSKKVTIRPIEDGSNGIFYPSTGEIVIAADLPQNQMKSTLLHELQHAVQYTEGFASGSNSKRYAMEPAVIELKKKLEAAKQAMYDAISSGASPIKVKQLEENYKNNWLEYKNVEFRFYRGKSGEIEARLVQHRRNMPEEDRKVVTPQSSERDMIALEASEGYDPIVNTKGDLQKQNSKAPIVVPVGEGWNDTAKLHEILGRDDATRDMLTWKQGHKFEVVDMQTGKPTKAEFISIDLSPDTYTSSYKDIYPEIKTSTGEYPIILYKDEKGYSEVLDLSTYLGNTLGKKDTANLRFGRAQAPMAENVADDIPLLDLPEDNGFAKGGAVTQMDKQMNTLMAEGGLNTDGSTTDPVSGNEVPTGSTAEEVRDDIPAKLSEGEYVVPADVVKFFGVHFFEKLRAKAKAGLEEMAADGRVGGEPTDDTEDDSLPFSADELQAEDDGMDTQMQDAGFATGGAVTGNPTPADIQANTSSFNSAAYPIGFSLFNNTPAATQPTAPVATTTKVYVNAAGQTMVVPFDANGKPTITIPAGYYPQTAAVGSTGGGGGSGGGGTTGGTTGGGTGDTANKGGRIKLEDVSSEGALLNSGLLDIEQMNKSKKTGSIAGGLLGGGIGGALLGGTIGTGWQLSELRAKIQIADAYGWKDAATKLREAEAEAVKGLGTGTKIVTDLLASGNLLAKSFLKHLRLLLLLLPQLNPLLVVALVVALVVVAERVELSLLLVAQLKRVLASQ